MVDRQLENYFTLVKAHRRGNSGVLGAIKLMALQNGRAAEPAARYLSGLESGRVKESAG